MESRADRFLAARLMELLFGQQSNLTLDELCEKFQSFNESCDRYGVRTADGDTRTLKYVISYKDLHALRASLAEQNPTLDPHSCLWNIL